MNLSEDSASEDDRQLQKASESEYYPVSKGQKRLWLIQEKHPGSAVYNYCETWTFRDNSFDRERFISAVEELLEKHSILRSNYHLIKEELMFSISKSPDPDIYDAENVREPSKAVKWIKERASKAFDLGHDKLLRVLICRVSTGDVLVGFVFHHIVTDAWSMDIFRTDFVSIYFGSQKKNGTCEYTFQDYALHESQLDENVVPNHQPKSSRDILLEVPTDFPRPAEPSYQGKFVRKKIKSHLSEGVSLLIPKLKTTSFNFFLALYKVLLFKYSNSGEILLGIPVLNREKEVYRDIVGYFVDAQLLKIDLYPQLRFDELLVNVRNKVLSTLESPGGSKVNDRNLELEFQTMFVAHGQTKSIFEENKLPVDVAIVDLDVAKFDLTVHLFEKNSEFEIGIEYSTDLFQQETIDQFFQHFETLISSVLKQQDIAISDLEIISEKERLLLESGLNEHYETESGFVIEEILSNCKKKPEQVAVVCGSQSITYGELGQRSAAIAAQLHELDVDIAGPVSIYLERSVDYVVSIVAILRYGGYYLPLDPAYPDDRIMQYIVESGSRFIISSSNDIKSSLIDRETKVLLLDKINEKSADSRPEATERDADTTSAYIIFTSGSSSKPKGVPVSNANLYSSNNARRKYYGKSVESFLLVSSFSFDSSVAGLFWTLTSGGKLVISKRDEQLDARKLARIISAEAITHTLMLPSLYGTLIETNELHRDSSLQVVIVAGEECPRELINAHTTFIPGAALYNEYGPTEGTVWCTVQKLDGLQSQMRVPIGSPISNTKAYILDEKRVLTPQGLFGELYIGGGGVVSGYNSSEDNEGKFFDNPYSSKIRRIYRTGDLVRLQSDGLLEFHGRIDSQVKVRGHRIELEEIENVALEIKGLNTAKAVATDVQDTGSLSIILVFTGRNSLKHEGIRSFLAEKLPHFMVPDHILKVQGIPKLPNGKVDQGALRALVRDQNKMDIQKLPSSYLEKQVATIWADVLGTDEVPVDKDFFQLGGNSLQSIRIIARCRDIGCKLTPEQFLRNPTVESLVSSLNFENYEKPANTLELEIIEVWEKCLSQKLIGSIDPFDSFEGYNSVWASVVEELHSRFGPLPAIDHTMTVKEIATRIELKAEKDWPSKKLSRVIPVKTSGKEKPVFCIHSEFYYETVFSQLTRHLPQEYPVYSILSISPELVKDYVPTSIEDIAKLCIEEIKLVQDKGPFKILSFSIGNVIAFEISKQLKNSGEEAYLILIDPPLFLHKSRSFNKGNYQKVLKKLNYLADPKELLNKIGTKIKQKGENPEFLKDTGLLKKFLLSYKVERVDVETILLKTPAEYKQTYEWDPLVNLVEKVLIDAPHESLMREPYTGLINEAITKQIRAWDAKDLTKNAD